MDCDGGKCSGIVDGAAAVVVTREKTAKAGLETVGRIVSWAVTGVDPSIMGIGPVPSSQKALKLAAANAANRWIAWK